MGISAQYALCPEKVVWLLQVTEKKETGLRFTGGGVEGGGGGGGSETKKLVEENFLWAECIT